MPRAQRQWPEWLRLEQLRRRVPKNWEWELQALSRVTRRRHLRQQRLKPLEW